MYPVSVSEILIAKNPADLELVWNKVSITASTNTSFEPGTDRIIAVHATEDVYLDTAATTTAAEALTLSTAGRLIPGGGSPTVLRTGPVNGAVGCVTRLAINGELRWADIGLAAVGAHV